MMRKVGLMILMAGAMVATSSMAAEKKTEKKEQKAPAKKEQSQVRKESPQARLVTQGEYAHWLVRVLGLARFLDAEPTDPECFAILLQNGITPKAGWQADKTVTKGDLARTVVQALGREDDVKNPDNDQAWIDYLGGVGIDFGTVGEAVDNLDPIDAPLAAEAIIVTGDPLGKVAKHRPIDEIQGGNDLFGGIARVFSASGISNPPPMTPN